MKLAALLVAVVCFVIAGLAAHGTITTDEAQTWLCAGLVFFAGSFLPIDR